MTLQDYINNPAGSKASVISNRKMYEDLYRDKWGKIMTRENGHIDYKLYMDKKNRCIAHLRIPSEAIDKFYYDVVFLFEDTTAPTSLKNCTTRFFSNDPSFNYTFAYAFNKKDMCIKELKDNMSSTALKKAPKEKNPDNTIGYVKTFYFAYIYMSEKGLFNKLRFKSEAEKIDWKVFSKLIEKTDDKIEARQQASVKKEKEAKKESIPFTKRDIKNPEIHNQSFFLGNIKRTPTIGNVKHSVKTAKAHSTNKINKVKKR
jgi:hypothetical protein